MSPCPQMRCRKGQRRAHSCCHFCTGAVQDFPLQRKAKGFCSHSFCLRFGAVFPHENSANKTRPCRCRFSPRGESVQYNMPQSDETQGGFIRLWTCKQHHSLHGIQLGSSSQCLPRRQTEQSALSKEGICLISSCGTVKLKFNLSFFNTLWHCNHCWQ